MCMGRKWTCVQSFGWINLISGVAKPGPGRARPDQYYARHGQSEQELNSFNCTAPSLVNTNRRAVISGNPEQREDSQGQAPAEVQTETYQETENRVRVNNASGLQYFTMFCIIRIATCTFSLGCYVACDEEG